MAERMHHIAIAGEPTHLNGLAGEFVLFGRTFGTLAPLRNVPNREADSRSKLAVRLFATMMLLSTGFVLYPQDSANAAKFYAQLRRATATGHPAAHSRRWMHVAPA